MKLKTKLIAALLVATAVTAVSCTPDNSDGANAGNRFELAQVAASTTSITVAWEKNGSGDQNYTISVYSDPNCSELYQEYEVLIADGELARFTVPYLDSTNKYYIRVKDASGKVSEPYEVALRSVGIKREILSQNFDNLFWGYDYIHQAHSVVLDANQEEYMVDNLTDARHNSKVTTNIKDNGRLLFKYKSEMVDMMGLTGWQGSEVRILPGYVKVGYDYGAGHLESPTFSMIEEKENADITVSFKACIFANSMRANEGIITASIINKKSGQVVLTKDLVLNAIDGTPEWSNYKFTAESITCDCYLELRTNDQTRSVCIDDIKVLYTLSVPEGFIYGYVIDKESKKPIADVAVTDGFSVTKTDRGGLFKLRPHDDAMYIYYTTPAEYKINRLNYAPRFYTLISEDIDEYNFELELLPEGKETQFSLFALSNVIMSNSSSNKRVTAEVVPHVKAHAQSQAVPCYGVNVGSGVNKAVPYMSTVYETLRYDQLGITMFHVMGNADIMNFNTNNPIEGENFQLEAQRAFESTFGPVNYSFDRGDVHIVCMRNSIYESNTSQTVTPGFMQEQYDWLKQDLALVPKEKMVVFCANQPMHGNADVSDNYVKEVYDLLNEFAEVHIISAGKQYSQENIKHDNYNNLSEHGLGAVAGTYWSSNVCPDGTPNGYNVFISDGNKLSDSYRIGYNEGMNDRNCQIRLYRGNAITGAAKDDNKNGAEGYYAFNYESDVVLANVFNATPDWKIEIWEDDELSGYMTLIEPLAPKFDKFKAFIGDGTLQDPYRFKEDVEASMDMWALGFHLGVLDGVSVSENGEITKVNNSAWHACNHLYKFKLFNPNSKNIKVVAYDQFGNKYEETKFYDYKDNDILRKPVH